MSAHQNLLAALSGQIGKDDIPRLHSLVDDLAAEFLQAESVQRRKARHKTAVLNYAAKTAPHYGLAVRPTPYTDRQCAAAGDA